MFMLNILNKFITAPKIINPNDTDCPKIEYNSYNNKINTCNKQNNNELKGIYAQNYKIIHSVSDYPNSSSEDCILIEDDEDEESMLVSDSGQNKSNGYLINDEKKYSSTHLDKTIELSLSSSTTSASTTILTNNKIYNNTLYKFQISQKNNQLAPPSATSLITSNNYISESQKNTHLLQNITNREIATSTTSLDKETISTNKSLELKSFNNNLSIKSNESGTITSATNKATASKLANELIKRLQSSSETTKSIILNNNKKIRLNNINCVPPTKFHRLPNPRDVASVDSLNLEMCHFKPIKTVPITPIKTPNAVIIKIPVAKRIKIRNRKCDVFIGPKKGLMPVLFSTTTSERFSAFYLYNNNKHSIPLIEPCQKKLKKGNKLKNNTPIKPNINVTTIKQQKKKKLTEKESSLKLQKTIKKKMFEKKCIVKLKRCKCPPKYIKEENIPTIIQQSNTNLKSIETNFSINNKTNIKISKTSRKNIKKIIEFAPKNIPKLLINSNNNKNMNPTKRTLRTNLQPINYCEKKKIQRVSKEKNIYSILPPNKLEDNKQLKTRSKTVISEPYISQDISIVTTNPIETVTSNKINDKKKTTNSLRIKKNQERLDFEYAKRLQYEFLKECGPIQPIALRLRRRSMSSISIINNIDQKNNDENIDGTNSTYNKSNHNINRKTGQNLITSNKTVEITAIVK